jgi:hypothetical protein
MIPAGFGTKIDCSDEVHEQFTRLIGQNVVSLTTPIFFLSLFLPYILCRSNILSTDDEIIHDYLQ